MPSVSPTPKALLLCPFPGEETEAPVGSTLWTPPLTTRRIISGDTGVGSLNTRRATARKGLEYGRLHTLGSPAAQPSPTPPPSNWTFNRGTDFEGLSRFSTAPQRLYRARCTGDSEQNKPNKIPPSGAWRLWTVI